jgi:hypothetical protein
MISRSSDMPRRRRWSLVATLAATAALTGGAGALAPASASAMTAKEKCEADGGEWRPFLQECVDSLGSTGGGPSRDGSDLWGGWLLDQDDYVVIRDETPTEQRKREEREARIEHTRAAKVLQEELAARLTEIFDRWSRDEHNRLFFELAEQDAQKEKEKQKKAKARRAARRRPPV